MFGETGSKERRFGRLKEKQSLLDSVTDESSKLKRSLGAPDRNNPPAVIVGGGNGRLKGNRHIVAKDSQPRTCCWRRRTSAEWRSRAFPRVRADSSATPLRSRLLRRK
jgi:hypothetical protein